VATAASTKASIQPTAYDNLNTLIRHIVNTADGNAVENEFEAFVNRSSAPQLKLTLDTLGSSSTTKTKAVAYSGMLNEYNELEAEVTKMEQAKIQISNAMMYQRGNGLSHSMSH
jgi:hypothetical protein